MEDQVREFHSKFGFPVDRNLQDETIDSNAIINYYLRELADILNSYAQNIELEAVRQSPSNNKLHRAHLMTEEFGEVILALLNGDKVALADALGDLRYVVDGTMITYGIPIQEVLDEIHRSNMTKTRHPSDTRMKGKGTTFEPPQLKRICDV